MALGRRIPNHSRDGGPLPTCLPPPAHPYLPQQLNRLLDEAGSIRFVAQLCRPYYAARIGRPRHPAGQSLHPHALSVGILRRASDLASAATRLALRRQPLLAGLLGYLLHEATPEHSSLTKLRQRSRGRHEEVFALGCCTWRRRRGPVARQTSGSIRLASKPMPAMKTFSGGSGDDWTGLLRQVATAGGWRPQRRRAAPLRQWRQGQEGFHAEWVSPTDPTALLAR